MADWNSLLDDPLFNAGIGLLGGAATPNPWAAAADQLNKYQTLRQNREAQQMHSKLYEAQSRREQEQADIAARKNKGLADFQSQYDPAATPQDQLRLGIKTGAIDPASALNMQYQQAELNMRAKEAAAARAEAQAATLEQKREAEQMRADAAKERVQMQGQFMLMARQIGAGNQSVMDELRRQQIEKLKRENAAAAEGKPLPTKAINDLSAVSTSLEDTNRLAQTFKPEYSGQLLGSLNNLKGRTFGDTGQAQWWQDLEMHDTKVRHELFGSALTEAEKGQWDKITITPSMNPKQVVENLNRRRELEARAASKLARAYQAGGYNPSQISEILGTGAQYLNEPAPPATGTKGVTKVIRNPKTGKLEVAQ